MGTAPDVHSPGEAKRAIVSHLNQRDPGRGRAGTPGTTRPPATAHAQTCAMTTPAASVDASATRPATMPKLRSCIVSHKEHQISTAQQRSIKQSDITKK